MTDDCYNALIPLTTTTLTLCGTTYKVFAGGIYGPTDLEVQHVMDTHNQPDEPVRNHFDGHGECLSRTLLRWKLMNAGSCGREAAEGKKGAPGESALGERMEWVYCPRDEAMGALPRSFWLLEVQ
jgi:hypothetical protein